MYQTFPSIENRQTIVLHLEYHVFQHGEFIGDDANGGKESFQRKIKSMKKMEQLAETPNSQMMNKIYEAAQDIHE